MLAYYGRGSSDPLSCPALRLRRQCRARVLPALADEVPGLVRVGAEPGLSKTRADLPVTFFREDPELKTEVHVERAHVPVDGVQPLLVDQKRRHQAADDHPLVPEVGELGGNVQADGAYLLELRGSVTGGGRRL